uniref:Spore protein YkvP/CgeB glycosyl transferase-like domain-containing protein n=1 Tax=Magnetococcus massalia (strain MO-1) TaxID=451514 RepID=A0A1S7LPX1_MAGMO|nr:Protein of unknown function. Containing tetratricopeptide TPR-4 [Candidatus Magnetococcus massalia]
MDALDQSLEQRDQQWLDAHGAERALAKKPQQLAHFCQELLLQQPEEGWAIYLLARLQLEQGDYAAAQQTLQQAKQRLPNESSIRYFQALNHFQQGRYAEAQGICRPTPPEDPWYGYFLRLLAQCATALHEDNLAWEMIKQAWIQQPCQRMLYPLLLEMASRFAPQATRDLVLRQWQQHFPTTLPGTAPAHLDTLFLDPSTAYRVVAEKNSVNLAASLQARQLCFYQHSATQESAVESPFLIAMEKNLPPIAWVESGHRLPMRVIGDDQSVPHRKRLLEHTLYLDRDLSRRRAATHEANLQLSQRAEQWDGDGPLRLLIACSHRQGGFSRAQQLVAQFKALGHQAELVTEENNLESLNPWMVIDRASQHPTPHMVIAYDHIPLADLAHRVTLWEEQQAWQAWLPQQAFVQRPDLQLKPLLPWLTLEPGQNMAQELLVSFPPFSTLTPLLQEPKRSLFTLMADLNPYPWQHDKRARALWQRTLRDAIQGRPLPQGIQAELQNSALEEALFTLQSAYWLIQYGIAQQQPVKIYGRGWQAIMQQAPHWADYLAGSIPHGEKLTSILVNSMVLVLPVPTTTGGHLGLDAHQLECPTLWGERYADSASFNREIARSLEEDDLSSLELQTGSAEQLAQQIVEWISQALQPHSTQSAQATPLDALTNREKSQLKQAFAQHQEGLFAPAEAIYGALYTRYPNQPDVAHLLGELQIHQARYSEALAPLLHAVALQPTAVRHHSLGQAHQGLGQLAEAEQHMRRAVQLDPGLIPAINDLAQLMVLQQRFIEAEPLLKQVREQHPDDLHVYLLLAKIYQHRGLKVQLHFCSTMYNHLRPAGSPAIPQPTVDLFFLTAGEAAEQAKRGLKVPLTATIQLPQLCYTTESIAQIDAPDSLIHIPGRIKHFFLYTMHRRPHGVAFDPAQPEQVEQAAKLAALLDNVGIIRTGIANQLFKSFAHQPPPPAQQRPVRVLAGASRLTMVMQHATKRLLSAMARAGCETQLVMGRSDHENADMCDMARAQQSFNPHLILNINHQNNQWLHPDLWNAIWWQDPMPDLQAGKPLLWRPRDLTYAALSSFDPMLEATGCPHFQRQNFCVDTQTFASHTPLEKRQKIIFVGSAYRHHLNPHHPVEQKLVAQFIERTSAGGGFSKEEIFQLAEQADMEGTYLCEYIYPYAVRDLVVTWLCELAPELPYHVEIYGRGWESNPTVAPYFQGPIEHGMGLVKLYNQARYALAAEPHAVNTQRMAEIAACGAIPLLHDQRRYAEPPHWDNEVLYFNTKRQLKEAIDTTPSASASAIAEALSYDSFAKRILSDAGLLTRIFHEG